MKQRLRRNLSALRQRASRWQDAFLPRHVLIAGAAAALVTLVLILVYRANPDWQDEYWPGVFVEATGFLLDLAFFGVGLAVVLHLNDRRQKIERYQEEIQDFKRWNSEEGRMRIAGAVRRLVTMGRTGIDFTGIRLVGFSFRQNDIKSISGSRFYEGEWGTLSSREDVEMDAVDFSFVDCSNVVFSAFNPFQGFCITAPVRIKDCLFSKATLRGAVFNGALLTWTEVPPASHYEEIDTDEDGHPIIAQVTSPPFDGADLSGTSFRDVQFVNADFRYAENILEADFTGAKGLESTEFDDESIKVQKAYP